MLWNIETRFAYHDGTHAIHTFIVRGRTMEKGIMNGRLIVQRHLAANRYKDAKILRVYRQEKVVAR